MGLKKIEELRKELFKKKETAGEFVRAARGYYEIHQKMKVTMAEHEKARKSHLSKIEGVQTHGIKEFEDYKKKLVSAFSTLEPGELPDTDKLDEVIRREGKDLDEALGRHLEKLAASFPKEVTKGMTFKAEFGDRHVLEVMSDAQKASNANLKGDDAIYFDIKTSGGKTFGLKLSELKKNYKFIKV